MINLGAVRAQYHSQENASSLASRLRSIRENIFNKNTADTINIIEDQNNRGTLSDSYYVMCPGIVSQNRMNEIDATKISNSALKTYYDTYTNYGFSNIQCDAQMLAYINDTMSKKFVNYKTSINGSYIKIDTEY
jgi:hypothetical protein